MAENARQIIVIGAGIGGLAAGLALQRRGFRVVIYERAPEIREIGAGVVIAPNARRALRETSPTVIRISLTKVRREGAGLAT